jgi:hypothetical protein
MNNWLDHPIHQNFAPANFEGDDMNQPLAASFDVSGTGNAAPYTTALTTIVSSTVDEMNTLVSKEFPKTVDWKKRLREFLSKKNTDLLDFLNLSVTSHPTLGKGDALLWKFNNKNLVPFAGLVKKAVMDISGADIFSEVKKALAAIRTEDSIADFKATVQYIYDEYKKAGDSILKAETVMKVRLEVFDKIQKNIVALLELDSTSCKEDLMVASEKYLGEIFEKHKIQTVYEELIAAYRRFVVLREFVQMLRVIQTNENEPLCTICLEQAVTHCMSPCGHTFCEQCLKRQVSNCFMCRTRVESTVRLYFG